jgi:hypothetical protein
MERFVLMDYAVGKFYQSPGEWTEASINAFNFKSEAHAARVGREMGIDTLVVMVTDLAGGLTKGTRAADIPHDRIEEPHK